VSEVAVSRGVRGCSSCGGGLRAARVRGTSLLGPSGRKVALAGRECGLCAARPGEGVMIQAEGVCAVGASPR